MDVRRGRSKLVPDNMSHTRIRVFLASAPKRVILAVVQQSQRLCLRRH